MKFLTLLAFVILGSGCAHGKLGRVEQPLDPGAVTKNKPIYVESIVAKDAQFSGDKSGEIARVDHARMEIETLYNKRIVDALIKKGYDAHVADSPVKGGLVITGHVSRVENGSAAARILVGMGAGSANMFTNFKIEDRDQNKTLSKFEVIATSGGRGGLTAAGNFMDAHLADGADKVAEYIDKANQ